MGRQTYHVAKGLYVDQDGVFGAKAILQVDKNNLLEVFVGRDDEARDESTLVFDKKGKVVASDPSKTTLLQVINWAHKFHGGSIGTYWAKQGTQSDTYLFLHQSILSKVEDKLLR